MKPKLSHAETILTLPSVLRISRQFTFTMRQSSCTKLKRLYPAQDIRAGGLLESIFLKVFGGRMFEGLRQAFYETHLIFLESGSVELIRTLAKPMTESMTGIGVTATGIALATIIIDSIITKPTKARRRMARHHRIRFFGRPRHARKVEEQEFTLKGRAGQTIGRVRMNKGQKIEEFIQDLESLNQIHRGRHSGPSVQFEICELENPLVIRKGSFTHYSPFIGHFLFGDIPIEVAGIAKFRRRGKMVYSEVEFDSDLGHFRLELPHYPGLLHSNDPTKTLRFKVDIGSPTLSLI